jgi:hypothetical protein
MAMKAIASRATRPSRIIQIHMFELLLSVVCVVVVWLTGREVCVVVVVEVVEVELPLVCAGGALVLVFWANAGTAHAAARDRLRASSNALRLPHN